MTVHTLNLNNALPTGITLEFEPPCKGTSFTKEVLEDLFSSQLPTHLEIFRGKWDTIPVEQVSGLAPTTQRGPICAMAKMALTLTVTQGMGVPSQSWAARLAAEA